MNTPHHTRRSGLGRPVADIVGVPGTDPAGIAAHRAMGGLFAGPAVVPMDVVPFPMLVADATGRALAVNRRWTDLSGLGREESLGYGWLAVLRHEDRLPLRSQVERVAVGDVDLRAEYAWLPAGGGRAAWWLASHQRAGERVVGIAVAPLGALAGGAGAGLAGADGRGRREDDPVRAELPALLISVRALVETLDRLLERISRDQSVPV